MSKEKVIEIYNPNVEKRNAEWREIVARYGYKLSDQKLKPVTVKDIEKLAYPNARAKGSPRPR